MTETPAAGYTRSAPDDAAKRWWTRRFALRLSLALVVAGALAGAILGPAGLLLAQLRVALSGGMLSFPLWMYTQFAAFQAVLGVLIASAVSIAAVLLPARPASQGRLLLRIIAGPLVTGGLMLAFSLLWGGGEVPTVLLRTAFGSGLFLLAAVISRTARVETSPDAEQG